MARKKKKSLIIPIDSNSGSIKILRNISLEFEIIQYIFNLVTSASLNELYAIKKSDIYCEGYFIQKWIAHIIVIFNKECSRFESLCSSYSKLDIKELYNTEPYRFINYTMDQYTKYKDEIIECISFNKDKFSFKKNPELTEFLIDINYVINTYERYFKMYMSLLYIDK